MSRTKDQRIESLKRRLAKTEADLGEAKYMFLQLWDLQSGASRIEPEVIKYHKRVQRWNKKLMEGKT